MLWETVKHVQERKRSAVHVLYDAEYGGGTVQCNWTPLSLGGRKGKEKSCVKVGENEAIRKPKDGTFFASLVRLCQHDLEGSRREVTFLQAQSVSTTIPQ